MADLRDGGYPSDDPTDAGDAGADAGRRDGGGGMDAAVDAGDLDATAGMDANTDATTGGGDAGDAGATSPLVTVLAPAPSTDPEVGPVLTGASVAVQCTAVSRIGRGINTVTIDVFDKSSENTPRVSVPANYGGDGGYGNTMVSFANVVTGPVRIRCTATDDVTDAKSGFDEVMTFYDGGPVVTFEGLMEDKVYARGGTSTAPDINVKFKVEPARLSTASGADAGSTPSDPDADIDTVALYLNEKPVGGLGAPVNGSYAKEVDFYTFFNGVPVDRVAVEVVASNARGVTVRKKVNILVDGTGPLVTVVSPPPTGDLPPFVGGTVQVRATAVDALAGLAAGATAVITDVPQDRTYTLTEIEPGVLAFQFDANSFADRSLIVAQLTVRDRVGNTTQVSHTMRVDTVAPWVSLDPPNVRIGNQNLSVCSGSFDPLGSTPTDGQVVQRQARFRALVWERATIVSGATELYMSGVRPESVDFIAQPYGAATDPSSGRQLLVDRNGDGVCDVVDDSVVSAGQLTPFRVRLRFVSTGGVAVDAETPYSVEPIPSMTCGMGLSTGQAPAAKCAGNDMSFVVSHTAVSRDPVVYGYEPTSLAPACTGASLDFGGAAGWYCVTTVARDKSGTEGNLGIAPPVRVCRKLLPSDCGGAPAGSVLTPPAGLTCTDGCTLPTVWTAPAMPRIVPQ